MPTGTEHEEPPPVETNMAEPRMKGGKGRFKIDFKALKRRRRKKWKDRPKCPACGRMMSQATALSGAEQCRRCVVAVRVNN